MRRQIGFIQLTFMGYVAIGVIAVVTALSGAVWVQTKRLDAAKHQHEKTRAEFKWFVDEAKAAGEAQKAKNAQLIKNQQRISNAKVRSLETRLAATRAEYDRLRSASPGGGAVPTVPDTSPVVDDAARDARLLEVLRLAQEQADRLTALQEWMAEQGMAQQ